MKPSKELLDSLSKNQQQADKDNAAKAAKEAEEREVAEIIRKKDAQVKRARRLAELHANVPGDHIYLSDALSKSYYSRWYDLEELPFSQPDIVVQAQIGRSYEVVHDRATNKDAKVFSKVSVLIKLYDKVRQVGSKEEEFARFTTLKGVEVRTEDGLKIVEPDTEEWDEVDEVLTALESEV